MGPGRFGAPSCSGWLGDVQHLSRELDDIVLSVTNFGPAIPAESLRTIFSAMVQLPVDDEPPGRPRTSLGLGLFIARETALAHGGSIHVSSTDTGGHDLYGLHSPRRRVAKSARLAPANWMTY